MIWKKYKNEIIVAFSILFILSGYAYKSMASSASVENKKETKYATHEFRELIALKKRWADKKMSKKVDRLKKFVPAQKMKWNKKGKKLTVAYKGLTAKELNKILTSILNLAIQIDKLDIKNNATSYDLELKCKW
jgi:hypothetical protein